MKQKRKPTSPGEILLKEYLEPMGITQAELARHIGVDYKVINRIVKERSSVTTDVAFKLSAALNTTIEFWLNLQLQVDVYSVSQSRADSQISPLGNASNG